MSNPPPAGATPFSFFAEQPCRGHRMIGGSYSSALPSFTAMSNPPTPFSFFAEQPCSGHRMIGGGSYSSSAVPAFTAMSMATSADLEEETAVYHPPSTGSYLSWSKGISIQKEKPAGEKEEATPFSLFVEQPRKPLREKKEKKRRRRSSAWVADVLARMAQDMRRRWEEEEED